MAGLLYAVMDWVLPRLCELCGERTGDGTFLCRRCEGGLERPEAPMCWRCGLPMEGSYAAVEACRGCREERFFDFARARFLNKGAARDLVLRLKYGRGVYLAPTLARSMAELWREYADVLRGRDWLLVPVPLSVSGWRKRGYNQAEELARVLAGLKGFDVAVALERIKGKGKRDRSQTGLRGEERFVNVEGLFRMRRRAVKAGMVEGRDVLLVDDVLTSGGTTEACARVLKEGGAREVGVLTVLRTTWAHDANVS